MSLPSRLHIQGGAVIRGLSEGQGRSRKEIRGDDGGEKQRGREKFHPESPCPNRSKQETSE